MAYANSIASSTFSPPSFHFCSLLSRLAASYYSQPLWKNFSTPGVVASSCNVCHSARDSLASFDNSRTGRFPRLERDDNGGDVVFLGGGWNLYDGNNSGNCDNWKPPLWLNVETILLETWHFFSPYFLRCLLIF